MVIWKYITLIDRWAFTFLKCIIDYIAKDDNSQQVFIALGTFIPATLLSVIRGWKENE